MVQQGYGPPPGQSPPHGEPPKKSGGHGCLIALGIVGGIILLGGLVVGFFVYRFANSADGKKIVSAVTSGAALVSTGMNAPGTKELRGIGCQTAMVVDTTQIEAIAAALGDGGTAKVTGDERVAVFCATNRGATKPTCDEVATTYVGAVGHATGPFMVSVGANGGTAECEERYSAEGKRIASPTPAPHGGTHGGHGAAGH